MATIENTLITDKINKITINSTIKCNPANYSNYSRRDVKYIVMHYTGNSKDTAQANCTYFSNGSRASSAHLFVDDNTIYQSVELCDAAWHCGCSSGYKNACRNTNSIGIEMCTSGNYIVSEQTQMNAAYVCAYICKLIGITANTVDTYVVRHYDVVASNKKCPAQFVSDPSQWVKFKTWVKNILQTNQHDISSAIANSASTSKTEMYRIRKSWTDVSSQIGAFSSLENAKAACKDGYSVFDNNGNNIYTKTNASTSKLKITSNIKSIQTWLNTYYKTGIAADGIYGSKTKAAFVKAWQTEVGGLSVDGVFGSKSKSASASCILKTGSSGILVTIWQAYLICRGYNPNGIDGTFGTGCKAATNSFQKANNLTLNGQVDQNTWTKALS